MKQLPPLPVKLWTLVGKQTMRDCLSQLRKSVHVTCSSYAHLNVPFRYLWLKNRSANRHHDLIIQYYKYESEGERSLVVVGLTRMECMVKSRLDL